MSALFQMFMRLHVGVYRATGGKLGGNLAGNKILLLTTIGNKSGQARTVPLVYFEDDGKTYIVASAGGAPAHPAWYKNLSAKPEVTIEMGSKKLSAKAVTTERAERDPVFEKIKKKMPQFAGYEKKAAGRVIPVVRLDILGPA